MFNFTSLFVVQRKKIQFWSKWSTKYYNLVIYRAMEAVFDPLRLKCANMWHYSIVPSRSEILLMYKPHSMIFTMHWSRKMILKGTFVCSNFPNLGGSFRPPCYIFLVTSIYCSCWSQASTLCYVLVSINVIMLLIISWNINIPRQYNNQWNRIRSIMARCNNIILYDSVS
jgi:hypothetical protein